jgi:hypothetical protein
MQTDPEGNRDKVGRHSGTALLSRPIKQQLGSIFEVHGVVVIPATAPNKTVFFEEGNDGHGNPVLVWKDAAGAKFVPAPVVGLGDVDVDR